MGKKIAHVRVSTFPTCGNIVFCVSCSILGRIIRVTQEVAEYRDWITMKWADLSLNSLTLNGKEMRHFRAHFILYNCFLIDFHNYPVQVQHYIKIV